MSVCVCVCILALVTQHAKRMRRIILSRRPVWFYHIFPHYAINGMIFGEKQIYWTYDVFFDFFYNSFMKNFSL
jgi:hypothetical protein